MLGTAAILPKIFGASKAKKIKAKQAKNLIVTVNHLEMTSVFSLVWKMLINRYHPTV